MAETAVVRRGLDEAVLRLVRSLRAAGAPVSSAEVVDALGALTLLPLERRDVVRATLAAALVKEPSFRPTFDRLFELHLPLTRPRGPSRGRPDGDEHDGDVTHELTDALRGSDDQRLRDLARDLVRRRADLVPGARMSEDAYIFRAMRGLNLDAIRDRLREGNTEGEGLTALQRRIIEEDLTERMRRFREMMREEVVAELLDQVGADELADRQRRPPPDEVDFVWARDSDLDAMRAALQPLSRRLALQLSHRRRRSRRGRLDVRRTVRRSLSTGGVLADPTFRRPQAGRPELVLLCDISGSMRAFARFTLELTYTLAVQFQRVRTFVFVDSLDEVTGLLEASDDLAGALRRVEQEARVVELDGQSWYGHSLEQFRARTVGDLTRRTTVIVLGDARTNFRTSGVDVLAEIRREVRALHWLNPEPRSQWDTGDSEMERYAAACDAVFEVRNLRQLEAYVAQAL